MTVLLVVVAVASAAAIAWVHAGYPALVVLRGRLRPRPVREAPIEPSVTVVVACHDEAAHVEAKIRSLLEQRYPADRLDVIVASDGSTDATVAIARGLEGPRVRVLDLPRHGKAFALNAGAAAARGEILAFTDANAHLADDAIARLVEPFADPEVGGACADQGFRAGGGAAAGGGTARGEGFYWRFDKWLKAQEARSGSIFASDGSLHAVRRELYVPIGDPAQADDMAISMRVVLQGRRLAWAARSRTWEDPPAEGRREFRRKARIANHSMSALLDLGPALWTSGWYSVQLVSHKLMRHLVPLFAGAFLVATALLAPGRPVVAALVGAQLLGLAAAAAGWWLRGTRLGRTRVLAAAGWALMAYSAQLVGVTLRLMGRRIRAWAPRAGAAG